MAPSQFLPAPGVAQRTGATHGSDPDAVSEVCIDMSPAFIKGRAESLPHAAVAFDKFHAVKIINEAVDQVRKPNRGHSRC